MTKVAFPTKMASKRRVIRRRSPYPTRQLKKYGYPVTVPRPMTLLQKVPYVDLKLDQMINVAPSSQGTGIVSTYVFSRMDFGGIISQVIGINNPSGWSRAANFFDEYAVTGFRLEWIPSNIVGVVQTGGALPAPTGVIYQSHFYEDLNTYNIAAWSQGEVESSGTLVMANTNEPQVITRSNRELSKTQNVSWKSTAASAAISNGNPQAAVAFRTTFDNGSRPMGTLKASWYITFRGIRII